MLDKYRRLSDQEKWRTYEALKREWVKANGYGDTKAYDAFIKQTTKDLGI